jgi:hypothetical protein
MFGVSHPSFRWDEVSAKQQTILLDFRRVRDPDLRRFLLLLVFTYFCEWVKTRGRNPQPFGLILDELVAMISKVVAGENFFGQELAEFIQQYQRNAQIWCSVALQSPLQLDTEVRETVLSLGTLILGQASTKATARVLADTLCFPNPQHIKYERVIQGRPYSIGGVARTPEPRIDLCSCPSMNSSRCTANGSNACPGTRSCCDRHSVRARSALRCTASISGILTRISFRTGDSWNSFAPPWQPNTAHRCMCSLRSRSTAYGRLHIARCQRHHRTQATITTRVPHRKRQRQHQPRRRCSRAPTPCAVR